MTTVTPADLHTAGQKLPTLLLADAPADLSKGFPGCHSPYGVLDMAGSMWEWTRDWYQPDYYSTAPARDPAGPATGKSRAIRGGGWMTQPTWLRASYRFRLPPSSRRPDLGFRCAHGDPGR